MGNNPSVLPALSLRFHRPSRRYLRPRRLQGESIYFARSPTPLCCSCIDLDNPHRCCGGSFGDRGRCPSVSGPDAEYAFTAPPSIPQVPLNDRCTKWDGHSQLMPPPCTELVENPRAGTLRRRPPFLAAPRRTQPADLRVHYQRLHQVPPRMRS